MEKKTYNNGRLLAPELPIAVDYWKLPGSKEKFKVRNKQQMLLQFFYILKILKNIFLDILILSYTPAHRSYQRSDKYLD